MHIVLTLGSANNIEASCTGTFHMQNPRSVVLLNAKQLSKDKPDNLWFGYGFKIRKLNYSVLVIRKQITDSQ